MTSNKVLKIRGNVQNYDNNRKKIEIKKEIKILHKLIENVQFCYEMECYEDINLAIERLKEIYENHKMIPILLKFEEVEGTKLFPKDL